MNPRPQRLHLFSAALALAASLVPSAARAESTVFQTTFASDVIVTPTVSPGTLTSTNANWYVMSSKDGRSSSVNGVGGLTLTHSASTSGVVEAAARLSSQPILLSNVGDYLEVTGTFYTDKVLNVAFGLYNSGSVEPLVTAPNNTTLLANAGLNSTAGATGGTISWVGYRAAVNNTLSGTAGPDVTLTQVGSTSASIQVRKTQSNTPTYQAYDLVSAGTGGYNAPTASSVGSVTNSTTSVVWASGFATAYNFTYRIQRSTSTAFAINYSIKDASNAVLFSASGTTTATDATPSALTQSFDSFAIGARNAAASYNSSSVLQGTSPNLVVTAIKLAGTNSDLARITTQPASQNLIPNQGGSLSVTAAGTGTIAYQWYKEGSPISGATSATYNIPSASGSDAGSYTVRVSNSYGYELSSTATVNVVNISAPAFTTQPTSQSVDAGTTLTLTAEASGAPTPTYQWYLDNSPISGATSTTYTVASATTANGGSYKVIATNSQGSATSNTVTVTINTAAPAITVQPAPVTVNVGQTISLSVTATGLPAPTYQWYKNTVAISGATGSSYSVASATTADAGTYTVTATNIYGDAPSNGALVTVNVVAPSFTTQPPSNLTVHYGQRVTLTAAYSGSAPLTYQWYKGTSLISGAVGTSYTITSVAPGDAGTYHVVVTNEGSSATSNDTVLSVVFTSESPVFATNFAADTLNSSTTPTSSSTSWFIMAGRTATNCTVGDDAATTEVVEARPLTLTWVGTAGSAIVETAARFSPTPVALSATGDFLRLRATMSGSNLRTLCFGLYNSGGVSPVALDGSVGGATMSSSTAVGGGTQNWLGYRSSFTAGNTSADAGTRPAQISTTTNRGQELLFPAGSTGAAFGEPAGVAVGILPSLSATVALSNSTVYTLDYVITLSATNQYSIAYSLYAGSSATGTPIYTTNATTTTAAAFPSAVATGFDALAIGLRNNDNLTAPTLVITDLSVVKGSAVAGVAPAITTQPTNQTLTTGATLTLTAAASGTPAPAFQWYKNDIAISGATSATYSINSVITSDSGAYKVVATNAVSSATSNVATVTVGSATPFATWASAQGLSSGVNDGFTQDPDGDGIVNLVEFALGGNPLSAGSAPSPVFARSGANFTFTYDVKTAATAQFSVAAESSTDLATWTTAVHGTNGVTISTSALDADTNRVVVTLPASGTRLFVRLHVTALP